MPAFRADACSLCGAAEDALDNLTGAQLLINQCGHKFCNTCTDRKFSQKSTFACPVCSSVIKKNTISEKTLDEIEAADDVKVRRRINDIYNKEECDFDNLRDFHDYQELKEDVIYALVHNQDRAAVEARVRAYQSEHVDEIRTRLAQRSERDRRLGLKLQQQQQESREGVREELARDALERRVEKEARRQQLQIRMGERTALSDELVAKQKELAVLKGFSSSSSGTGSVGAPEPEKKRPLSRLMAASVSGLESGSEAVQTESSAPAAVAVPKIAEQFLQQRPLPKFLPSLMPQTVPPGAEKTSQFMAVRRAAGGFDRLALLRRNYEEAWSQLHMCAAPHSSGGICWPWAIDKK